MLNTNDDLGFFHLIMQFQMWTVSFDAIVGENWETNVVVLTQIIWELDFILKYLNIWTDRYSRLAEVEWIQVNKKCVDVSEWFVLSRLTLNRT